MRRVSRQQFLIIATLIAVLFAITAASASPVLERVPGKTWMMFKSPEEAGFSAEKLKKVRALYDKIGAAALLVIYDGAVLVAWGDVETRFMCHSIRKSYMSALFGIT